MLNVVDPTPLNLIKTCLELRVVPDYLKQALVQHRLIRPNLNSFDLSNLRPISSLPFLAIILGKVFLHQLQSFLVDLKIFDMFQSGFRKFHSTEKALLKVLDVILATNFGYSVALVLLDMSAAFDTVYNNVLLSLL